MSRIVVAEYPKSGGTWLVSMLGYAMKLPRRDIYVTKDYGHFDIRRHPWYLDAHEDIGELPADCVIKSHELPGSRLTNFGARFLHLVRDGRDVVVSRYIYEKEFCVRNGIYGRFDESFDVYVPRVAAAWRSFVEAWLRISPKFYRYEDFLNDPHASLHRLLADVDFVADGQTVAAAVEANTSEQIRGALAGMFRHNTFVRTARSGDWRNRFDEKHVRAFQEVAGDLLVRLGYESCAD